ncbi:MAG: ATP-binding protein [Bacteroidota bacterium]|nr:ATP-binding protein [Bacteroidota bacterium]
MFRLLIRRYIKFQSSIYSRAVMVIGILSIFLLVSYQIIFRTVNDGYVTTVIYQNGENIGSIVEGALYNSMLENNKKELHNTLDIINTMPGIDDASMYDSENNLTYSSFSDDTTGHINPNCKDCHTNLKTMFSEKEKNYRIIRVDDECRMNLPNSNTRHLMIRSPILNQPSCYQNSACHAHAPEDEVLGSLIIKLPLAELDAAVLKASRGFTMLAIFITLFIAILLIVFTKQKIKRPLQEIIEASKAIATGKNSVRLDVTNDQLEVVRMVSLAFNHMMDNLETATTELQNWSKQLEYKVRKKSEELGGIQNELISIERKASLGKLSSSVAHELNNPLSGILVYTKLVTKKLRNMEIAPDKIKPIIKHLNLIEDETKRCGDIVRGLLDFSRKDQENFEPKHLHEVLTDTYQLMHHPLMLANINFIKEFSAKADLISCSPNQLKQVFVAILVNASEAATEDGEIQIKTINNDDTSIIVEIVDNGIGMAPEDIPHIFEPFFTTKHQGDGIGLGLAIVHGIILSHKGNINVTSAPGKGTTLSIKLPLITNQEN